MALSSQQDTSLCRAGGRRLGGISCPDFWGAAGPAWPQMPLRGRDAGGTGGSEDGEPAETHAERGPTSSLLNLQCWVWARRAGSESHPQCTAAA